MLFCSLMHKYDIFQVMHTHLRHAMPFPQIPKTLNVCAFEFLIMSDNYCRYFESVLPAEMRRHLILNREKILDNHMWNKDSTLLVHLRDGELATHFSRALEACHKGTGPQLSQPQASPMVVRSLRAPVASWQSSQMSQPASGAAGDAAAGIEMGLSAFMAAGLAMGQSHADASRAQTSTSTSKSDGQAAEAGSKIDESKADPQMAAAPGQAPAKVDSSKLVTPDRVDSKMASTSAAPTPISEKNAKMHVQKQLTSVARVS